jgi:hypothetical protein
MCRQQLNRGSNYISDLKNINIAMMALLVRVLVNRLPFCPSNQWAEIKNLSILLTSDPDFYKFVIKHIDESVPGDRLEKIRFYAQEKCPLDLDKLCHEIKKAVDVSIDLENVSISRH